MYHPEYAWMFFNWYSDNWYKDYIWSSCATQNLEAVIETSIAIVIYPRIEEDRLNDLNIGNIVSSYYHYKISLKSVISVMCKLYNNNVKSVYFY